MVVLVAFSVLAMISCEPAASDNMQTLKTLYKTYDNGEIAECIHEGKVVYCAGHNGYDAGSTVYDRDGNVIGTCSYAWGPVDTICGQLTECEVIYRVKDNIWGQPAVDKYNLKRW